MDIAYESLSDIDLVSAVLSDKNAFSAIISRYEDPLHRYVRRLGVRDLRDIEDILQNVFIKVYRYLQSFDKSFSFSSWIYRIAHNETYDFFRAKKRRPEAPLEEESEQFFISIQSDDLSEEDKFDISIDISKLNTALQSLDRKYRDVLLLRYTEDKDYRQISDILQIPEGSVATLIHRGKKELKKLLQTK
jgi:RNA polymerase sigma-70 factor (ECF subfamily)